MSGLASADVTRLAEALRESGKQADVTTMDVLVQASGYIKAEMEALAPVDTGRMRNSIEVRIQGNRVLIGPDPVLDYPIFVEMGTGPHVIKPKNSSVLVFNVGGRKVFARSVNHPGTRAQPFIRPAFEKWVEQLGTMAAEANVQVIDKEAR